jgi:GH24 family phage-related lysozyme (muramidase)
MKCGYLLIDLMPRSDTTYQLRTIILRGESTIVYKHYSRRVDNCVSTYKMKDKKTFIIFLNDAFDQQLSCVLKILTREQSQTIVDIIYNVFHGVSTISDINKTILTKHKKLIRNIVSRRSTLTKRKKLLFKSRKILTILFQTYINYVS